MISSQGFHSRGWSDFFPNAKLIIDSISPNPTINDLSTYIESIKNIEFETLVAIGGGSVIDVAKALSVLANKSKKEINNILLEGGKNLNKQFHVIAIPTTAGTGAEVTPFSTIWDDKNKKKYSLGSSTLYPVAAIVDPNLVLTLGLKETGYTGLDALSHCFESLWNKNATLLTKSIAYKAIDVILDTLPSLFKELNNVEFRSRMSWASYMGGLCINHTKTAVAHSISYPLTSHLGIPHGLASGVFLPEILSFNKLNDKTGTMDEIYDKLSNSKSLDQKLSNLYESLEKHDLIKTILENKVKINSLVSEMINPARSRNNIVDISYEGIQNIIDLFYQNHQKN